MYQVLIVKDTIENREKLKYMNSINWTNVLYDCNFKNVYLAEYSFCEYTDKDKYINTFYFLDMEKINRIQYFLKENKNKNIIIICDGELKIELQKLLPTCNYNVIKWENYIEEHTVYG